MKPSCDSKLSRFFRFRASSSLRAEKRFFLASEKMVITEVEMLEGIN